VTAFEDQSFAEMKGVMEPYTVNAVQAGMKLVDFLAERSSCSRRKAKTLLDQRCVFVNQQIIWMAHHTAVGA